MRELQRLRADHAAAVLAFERENRAYFAASISDRGDAYFAAFAERHAALLAEQDEGVCHFHVLVDESGAVLGRFNLVDVADGAADLGYRVARAAAGRGVATATVRQLAVRARDAYGLTELRAATSLANVASRAVLARNGFVPAGETTLNDRPAVRYLLRLPPSGAPEPADAVHGRVERWDDEEGWGVLTSDATPGGCFAPFSAIEADGSRALPAGAEVAFTVHRGDYEGYPYRATWILAL